MPGNAFDVGYGNKLRGADWRGFENLASLRENVVILFDASYALFYNARYFVTFFGESKTTVKLFTLRRQLPNGWPRSVTCEK